MASDPPPFLPGLAPKRKKGAKAPSLLHQHMPHTAVTDELSADGRRRVKARTTLYAADDRFPAMEDTDTMARADQVDGFSYLLGLADDEFTGSFPEPSAADDDSAATSGLSINVRKRYASSVRCLFLVWRVALTFRYLG